MKSADELFNDIEKYRNLSEMIEYFEEKKEIINRDGELKSLVNLKTGRFKVFLEEFYPLMLFMQSRYCDKSSDAIICIGNQGFDAIIKTNNKVRKLEFTIYHDGAFEHKDGIKLNKDGIGNIRYDDGLPLDIRVEKYIQNTIQNVQKKQLKDYKGIELVFLISTFGYYEVFDNSSDSFKKHIIDILENVKFNAASVYVIFLGGKLEHIDKDTFKLKENDV